MDRSTCCPARAEWQRVGGGHGNTFIITNVTSFVACPQKTHTKWLKPPGSIIYHLRNAMRSEDTACRIEGQIHSQIAPATAYLINFLFPKEINPRAAHVPFATPAAALLTPPSAFYVPPLRSVPNRSDRSQGPRFISSSRPQAWHLWLYVWFISGTVRVRNIFLREF